MANGEQETTIPRSANPPIVFFDGVCGLCDQTVKWLIKHDYRHRLRYAPLQGGTAARLLSPGDTKDVNSLVLLEDGKTYRRSSAVVRILWKLSRWWMVVGLMLWSIPRPLRDFGYRTVARYRYRWFGKHEACRLPLPEERELFLP